MKSACAFDLVYIGAGYVGITGAVHHALAGQKVLVYDVDASVVQKINAGEPRGSEFLSYINENVKKLVSKGLIVATTDFNYALNNKVFIIAVPTEKSGVPFDGIVEKVLHDLIVGAPRQSLIIVESTLTPGTIDRIITKESKTAGIDFNIAVCPRRDWFADPDKNLATLPRIVGGVTVGCTDKAVELLSKVSPNIMVTDYQTAELVKALENALLHVQVMFVHQLAQTLPNRNVTEAVRLATTHWRLTPLHLGMGVGGRCVPLGTQYLIQAAPHLVMGRRALDVDARQRELVAQTAMKNTPVGGKVLVLGIAYRENFKDLGLSPGLAVAQHLKGMGVDVYVNDPMWSRAELETLTKLPVGKMTPEYDSILLATPHDQYLSFPEEPSLWRPRQFVLDARGTWSTFRDIFDTYGVRYVVIGEPYWC